MVREKMVALPMVADMMQYLVANGWKKFEPLAKYYQKRLGIRWWNNFR
jgi:hypothetical protein